MPLPLIGSLPCHRCDEEVTIETMKYIQSVLMDKNMMREKAHKNMRRETVDKPTARR